VGFGALTRRGFLGAVLAMTPAAQYGNAAGASDDDASTSDDDASVAVDGTSRPKFGVRGRVTFDDGLPVAGVLIVAEAVVGTDVAVPGLGVKTSEDGNYAWPLPAGAFKLSVMIDGIIRGSVIVTSRRDVVTTADIVIERQP
jgi:hypothetical protein